MIQEVSKDFSTKEDTDFNEVALTVGSGQIPPGLEEGMSKSRQQCYFQRTRRISTLCQLHFVNLFQTDATLLFEVLVTRVSR
jgi:hypothetical protein